MKNGCQSLLKLNTYILPFQAVPPVGIDALKRLSGRQ